MGAWIEEIYRLYPWPEDPSKDEGKRRYHETLNKFKLWNIGDKLGRFGIFEIKVSQYGE
jgi:hypothetical protein